MLALGALVFLKGPEPGECGMSKSEPKPWSPRAAGFSFNAMFGVLLKQIKNSFQPFPLRLCVCWCGGGVMGRMCVCVCGVCVVGGLVCVWCVCGVCVWCVCGVFVMCVWCVCVVEV